MAWQGVYEVAPEKYQCGYCGSHVASVVGIHTERPVTGNYGYVRICPMCDRPSYMRDPVQVPSPTPGNDVDDLPDEIRSLYLEARNAVAAQCYTASVLVSRKLLMNIAVSCGAEPNLRFIQYVEYLAEQGYVPPNGRAWVDHIRKRGNEATHEIKVMRRDHAEELITFLEMLLKFIYEFPMRIPPDPT